MEHYIRQAQAILDESSEEGSVPTAYWAGHVPIDREQELVRDLMDSARDLADAMRELSVWLENAKERTSKVLNHRQTRRPTP
jgi:hypothetical protein